MSMSNTQQVFADREERSKKRAEAAAEFLNTFAPGEDHDLLSEMMVTITRLAVDGCGRGEIKILNRALRELRYAFKIFAPYKETPKVSIFGSSRTSVDNPQYKQAVRFAENICSKGWMAITGAGDGIMRAGNEGATADRSFGVNISLPFEQDSNDIIKGDPKLVQFKYFFTRKLLFVKEARAIALFPGGFGTQDEGFEALTLIQTGKSAPVPIVLVDEPGGTYWQHWRTYVKAELLGNNMISTEDMGLFYLTDNVEDAVNEITHFYRRYNSSRYVRDQYVMRMNSPLPDDMILKLNQEFPDIVNNDVIRQELNGVPGDENELADLPRLVFRFNRRSLGRLRYLINAINDVE
jgi:uncharacterized protein (TIGR00730 family)